jgi:hypothetical protein
LIFSRSMTGGASLPAEVRRGLTMFANQPGAASRLVPRVLFLVGGNGETASLQDALPVPVEPIDVFSEKDKAELNGEHSSSLAACLGLVEAWSRKQVPINLANPKEPVAVVDAGKRRKLQVWIAAAVVLLVAWIVGQNILSRQKARVQGIKDDTEEIETKLNRYEQERKDLEGLNEWEKASISWVDEFYDLAARFPREVGFKITKVEIAPLRNKDRLQVRMTLQGVSPPGTGYLVDRFIDSLRDPHLVARVERIQGSGVFKIQVDIARQPAKDYQVRLMLPYSPPGRKKGQSSPKSFTASSEESGGGQ